jgi:hypothetical protein
VYHLTSRHGAVVHQLHVAGAHIVHGDNCRGRAVLHTTDRAEQMWIDMGLELRYDVCLQVSLQIGEVVVLNCMTCSFCRGTSFPARTSRTEARRISAILASFAFALVYLPVLART